MPAAEVDVTAELVRSLLEAQHPDLAQLELRGLANGWDNAMFRLGEELVVRLPRRSVAAELVAHESRWLPELAPVLPFPVPAPLWVGRPAGAYPWAWTIVPWFEGTVVGTSAPTDPARLATDLGRFLAALHQPAPPAAPVNPFRGTPLADRSGPVEGRIATLAAHIDVARVREVWIDALQAPVWAGPPLWIHGDLHPLNFLEQDGGLAAVIDFGDIAGGDPATDLLVAWALFDEEHRSILRAAADTAVRPIDDAMWTRGRGWAIAHSLAILANSADAPILRAIGERTLAAATE
ncbi:MAG: aminoglycoside phosphotransferase family protein [Actinomycetia bacterium]|nr:aminoglycoside phosphotransferase family protein [Actinomycetes bacterium]